MAHARANGIGERLAQAAREIHHALPTVRPQTAPGIDDLRDAGWQLVHLTADLADLAAVLAEYTGRHVTRPGRLRSLDSGFGGDPAGDLRSACRQLTVLRQSLDRAEAAARDYYTTLSHLAPIRPPGPAAGDL